MYNLNSIEDTFKQLGANPTYQNYLEFYKKVQKASALIQYLYIKAIIHYTRESKQTLFTLFVQVSKDTDNKQVLTDILTNYYDSPPHNLEYCHDPKDGIPPIEDYYQLAIKYLV